MSQPSVSENMLSVQSHKAKGLLDLKQCQAFAVDPTLYGRYCVGLCVYMVCVCVLLHTCACVCVRNDCLMVMLKYLNELSFYYFAAGTQEQAQVILQVHVYTYTCTC